MTTETPIAAEFRVWTETFAIASAAPEAASDEDFDALFAPAKDVEDRLATFQPTSVRDLAQMVCIWVGETPEDTQAGELSAMDAAMRRLIRELAGLEPMERTEEAA